MQKPYPPFACTTTPNVPELLQQLGCTLAISTYQAGKVIFISAQNPEKIIQLPRSFPKAMGIAVKGRKMAIATREEVLVLANSPQLASHYPKNPQTYDALFMPRATFYTGQIDIHDLDYGQDGLYAVNTSFSCLIQITDDYSFKPVWKPGFISKLASEDRCHLNGMAMENGAPKFVTAFAATDTAQGWRPVVTTDGLIMDVPSGEILAKGAAMPHSPRIFDGELYVLFSATGELVHVDRNNGKFTPLTHIKGFVRGMARYGDYLFIGLSRLRKNSSTFAQLKIADDASMAGIAIIHLPTGAYVGGLRYHSSVDEIYDVQVLPNMRRPGILNTEKEDFRLGLDTPESTYWAHAGQSG